MKLNKTIMSAYTKCGSVEFNNFVMGITSLDEVKMLLEFMQKNSHKTRIFRVYGRYSTLRMQQEKEVICNKYKDRMKQKEKAKKAARKKNA